MTIRTRILDILPLLVTFALVSVFASYVIVAFIVHDPMWLSTLAEVDRAGRPAVGPEVARLPQR